MRILNCHTLVEETRTCKHTRQTTRLLLPSQFPELEDIYTHQDCANNEYISLRNRHLVDKRPYPEHLSVQGDGVFFRGTIAGQWDAAEVMRYRMACASRWVDGRVVEPLSVRESILKYGGARRAALWRAHHKNKVARSEGKVEAFVKVDYYLEEEATQKPPRLIQYRGPAYNLELDPWLDSAERELLHGPGLGPTRTPSSSKGMDPHERAQAMWDKWFCFKDPVAVLMDYSAFDSTQFMHIKKQEDTVWLAMCPGLKADILEKQYLNRGRTKSGIRYRARATRMSGDRTTGGGNSLTNVLNFYAICDLLGIIAEFICDGDDSVAFMERADAERFMRYAAEIIGKAFGMVLKDCTLIESLDQLYYCHTKLIVGSGVNVLLRDPVRMFTRLCWSPLGVRGTEARDLLLAKLIGEMIIYRDIAPITLGFRDLILEIAGGDYEITSHAASEVWRNMSYRTGLQFGVLGNLDWVKDWNPITDELAERELERLYALSPDFYHRIRNLAGNCQLPAWGARKSPRIKPVAHPVDYCEECDAAGYY